MHNLGSGQEGKRPIIQAKPGKVREREELMKGIQSYLVRTVLVTSPSTSAAFLSFPLLSPYHLPPSPFSLPPNPPSFY